MTDINDDDRFKVDQDALDHYNLMVKMMNAGTYYVAIPDIHGHLDTLDEALAITEAWRKFNKINKNDFKYVFLGDYIDRGPDSLGVVNRVKEYVETKNAIALLGNHDMFLVGTGDMSMTKFDNGKWAHHAHLWEINGGEETCYQLFGERPHPNGPLYTPALPDIDMNTKTGMEVNVYRRVIVESDIYKFLKEKCLLMYETKDIFFCHAPQSQKDYTENSLIWGMRQDYSNAKGDACFITPNDKLMSVHGHFHRLGEGVNFTRIHNYVHSGRPKKVVLADTGCGCGQGGKLHPVIIKEYNSHKYPEVVAIL